MKPRKIDVLIAWLLDDEPQPTIQIQVPSKLTPALVLGALLSTGLHGWILWETAQYRTGGFPARSEPGRNAVFVLGLLIFWFLLPLLLATFSLRRKRSLGRFFFAYNVTAFALVAGGIVSLFIPYPTG